MQNPEERLKILLESPTWTPEDIKWLLNYLENSDGLELKQIMQENFEKNLANIKEIDPEVSRQLLKNIHEKLGIGNVQPVKSQVVRMWPLRVAAACVIVGILSFGLYLFFNRTYREDVVQKTQPVSPSQNDRPPGSDGAILTLADGRRIVLDSAQNGVVSQQGNLNVIKNGGQVIYTKQGIVDETTYNTMTTQRGKQFQLVLADGSKVWLNAASSIRFPTSFIGKERKVEITGEAYFEVAKNPSMPFKVYISPTPGEAEGALVEVLGTYFNVNAYDDEQAIKTTLLEGSVKVTKGGASRLLKPGQQAQLPQKGEIILINKVDVEAVVAWKNGRFMFDGSDMKTIMAQVMRWYDVDVVYEGTMPERFFSADISRNTHLSVFLKVLEESDIHFRIEGRKLIVMP